MDRKHTKADKQHDRRKSYQWYLFLLPTLLGILLFMAYPVIESFRLSFFKSNGTIESFRGLANYRYVLQSSDFVLSVFNTVFITFFQLLVSIPGGFVVALIINGLAGNGKKNFLKSLFFIPYITPGVAAGMLFLFVLHPSGILNQLLGFIGVKTQLAWLTIPLAARFGVSMLSIWQTLGFNIIIFLAHLQAISPEYYEAAALDGCSKIQTHWYITLPHMAGAGMFIFIMGWINGLQRFTDMYVLGGMFGSPSRSLLGIVGFIYERGFGNYEFGVAAAASYILFIMILLFTLINLRVNKGFSK
jgi:ABC-type sugar transport system permease subunit